MFTGIIEETGSISKIVRKGGAWEISVDCRKVLAELKQGDSVAIDGACLTVETVDGRGFTATATAETMDRTTLKSGVPGGRVNLERPLAAGGRLGGHIVQGHVDATATVLRDAVRGTTLTRTVRMDPGYGPYTVEKGSIALDGISLTIAGVEGRDITVVLIPETLRATAFGSKKAGDKVNVEFDIIAKYVEGQLKQRGSGLTATKLREYGF
jgi:riboflavin synthase